MTKLLAVCAFAIGLVGGVPANAAGVSNDLIAGVAVATTDGPDHDALKAPGQLRRTIPGLSRIYRTVRAGRIANRAVANRQSHSPRLNPPKTSQSHLDARQASLPTRQLCLHFTVAPRAPSLI